MRNRKLHLLITAGAGGDTSARSYGFMLDSGRCLENRSYYRRFIDFSASRGVSFLLWHFTDDQGCSLQFDSIPQVASPNAYSKTEMRELIAYARQRGIELIPELASLGHCRYLTRLPGFRHLNEGDDHFTGMCPVSDETRSIIRTLIDETIELFDSPNFHVGMDEVNIGEHPLTRAALQTQTQAELLADYTLFLHGILAAKNRRMWMWGDALLKYPQMRDSLPRDVVVCNWQYKPDASPDTTQTLLDDGFDVMLCSSLINHDQKLFPGDQFAVPNVRAMQSQLPLTGRGQRGRSGRVLGHLTTVWTPVRYIADSLWVGIDLAAAIFRDGPDVNATITAEKFAQSFYGLTGDDAAGFADVVSLLIEHSPARREWIAVAKLQPLDLPMLLHAVAASAAWSKAQDLLLEIADRVHDHVIEFRAFSLLIDMLAHTYSAAVDVAEVIPPVSTLLEMIDRGKAMIDRIDANYDRERFADDPRKYTAPLPSFQDEHLIPLLRIGLIALKKKLEESMPEVIISQQPALTVNTDVLAAMSRRLTGEVASTATQRL